MLLTLSLDLLSIIFINTCSTLPSFLLLRRLHVNSNQLSLNIAISGALGMGIISIITAIISALHLLNMPAWLPLVLFMCLTLLFTRPRLHFAKIYFPRLGRLSIPFWLLTAIIIIHLGINFIASFAPATGVDSLLYHLAIPALYIRKGGMEYLPSIYPSAWPSAVQMIFLQALWIRGAAVAQLANFSSTVFSVMLIWGIMIREIRHGALALLTALLYLSLSDVTYQSSIALIDVIASMFMLAALASCIIWISDKSLRWLILAGIFAGLFASSRITNAGSVIALAMALVAYDYAFSKERTGKIIQHVLIFSICAFIIAFPWYLRSYLYTGNPVYPFLYSIFGGKNFSPEAAAYHLDINLYKTLGHRSVKAFLQMPWIITMNPQKYRSGTIGPLLLAFAPLLFVYRKSIPNWCYFCLFFAIFTIPIWYVTYTRIRAILPVISVFFIVICLCINALLTDKNSPKLVKHTVLGITAIWIVIGLGNTIRCHNDAIKAVLGIIDPDSYADKYVRRTNFYYYYDYKRLNEILPVDANVLIWDDRGYYLDRNYTWASGLVRGIASSHQMENPEALIDLLDSLGITHAAWPHGRMGNKKLDLLIQTLSRSGKTITEYKSNTMTLARICYACE